MSRLSREQKRELKQQRAAGGVPGGQPAAGLTPIEVRVPSTGSATGGDTGGATVGGMPVFAAPGETVRAAVLNYLHRLALATGHPVLATIHDERIGYVVPLQVSVDGSSRYAGEPVRAGAGTSAVPGAWVAGNAKEPQPGGQIQRPQPQERPGLGEARESGVAQAPRQQPCEPEIRQSPRPPAAPVPPAPVFLPPSGDRVPEGPTTGVPAAPETPPVPRRDKATYVLRAVPEPTPEPAPEPVPAAELAPAPSAEPEREAAPVPVAEPELGTAPVRSPELAPVPVPGPEPAPARDAEPEHAPMPEHAPAFPHVPGLSTPAPRPPAPPVAPEPSTPTPSTFVVRAVPEPKPLPGSAATHVLRAVPESAAGVVTAPTGEFGPAPVVEGVPVRKAAPGMEALSVLEPEPEPKPAPVRGFDAVAEAVLAPASAQERDGAAAFLVEPVARINEAVKMGRIEAAAGMAERAVAEAAQSLGEEHPEVLKLRELTAYIAYLAGDALRSFHLSLDLARVRRRHRDPRAAYGNVQSAAAAWRAVRDPLQGLHLGRDLIRVWTELTADGGPAADDIEQLESARTRMGRLAERARVLADNPYTQGPRAHGQ
ncbi:hypothetical protein [Streptomyces sp. NBC_00996]|uniref:hypothetical protein n=1 Tax=Streptomyces sp. NBC_00996 TaxID=2903710 RepID=UPI0038698C66|nr:hypothetical protein OG390_30630 [Streptomyces sp. NBC_00996]